MSKSQLILSLLSTTPKSALDILNRAKKTYPTLTEEDVRGAIGSLRTKYCVWVDMDRGFWIDDPISTDLPQGADRWKKSRR
jgi:hypothetical protein